MRLERCPRCNARVAPTDDVCLDCGMDLKAHIEELRRAATTKRQLTPEELRERAKKVAEAAARGRAFGLERSEETRLRTFDKQEAEVVRSDVAASSITAVIALAVGFAAIPFASQQLRAAGGAEGLQVLSFGQLREWGFGLVLQPSVLSLVGAGLAVAGLLCAVGQAWRAVLGYKSVTAVRRGEKPIIVYTHPTTRAGLLIAAVACPPLGVLLGLIMKIGGRNEDTKSMGGQLLIAGLAVMLILGLNMLIGLAAHLKAPEHTPQEKEVGEVGMIWNDSAQQDRPSVATENSTKRPGKSREADTWRVLSHEPPGSPTLSSSLPLC